MPYSMPIYYIYMYTYVPLLVLEGPLAHGGPADLRPLRLLFWFALLYIALAR